MSRPISLNAQALEKLGAIGARQEAQADRLAAMEIAIAEDRKSAAEDRRRMLDRLDVIGERLAGKDADHERRLGNLELFRNRVGAVVALAGSVVTLLAGGLWYLLTSFWADLAAAMRKLWP